MASELLHALLALAVLLVPLGIQWFVLTHATRRYRSRARPPGHEVARQETDRP